MSNVRFSFTLFIAVLGITSCAAKKKASEKENPKFYELNKGNISVVFTNLGARIASLKLPDKNGRVADVVLGYDTIEEYVADEHYFGAILGRVANRIDGAQFSLNGTTYNTEANAEDNTLNGGRKGFDKVVWKVTRHKESGETPYITFKYLSFNGEQGFPGNLVVTVTYTLYKVNKLKVTTHAKTKDKATPVNLAQHSLWNLAGHNSGNILNHKLQIFASHITEVNDHLILTGKILSVEHTPYNFLQSRAIGKLINRLKPGNDEINYVLDNGKKKQLHKIAAILHDTSSGRTLKLWTTQPGLLLNAANKFKKVKGKGGALYTPYAGVILDAQGYPNSVNHKNFPSQIITKEKPYKQSTVFEFITEA